MTARARGAILLLGVVGCDDFGSPQLGHHEICDCERPKLVVELDWRRPTTDTHDDVEITTCQDEQCFGPARTSAAGGTQSASPEFPFSVSAKRVSLGDGYGCPVPTDRVVVYLEGKAAALERAGLDVRKPLRIIAVDPISVEKVEPQGPDYFSIDGSCQLECPSYTERFTIEVPGCD